MALTPRARELQQPLEAALGQLNALLHKGEFDASRAVRRFRVALSDYAAHLLLPPLLRQLRAQAPGMRHGHQPASREAMLAQLADGKSTGARRLSGRARRHQARDAVRGTLRQRCRPAIAAPGATCRCRNGWSAPRIGRDAARRRNEIDAALKAQGLRRHVALTLPHWSASTEVLAGTDLILTVASGAWRTSPRAPPRAAPVLTDEPTDPSRARSWPANPAAPPRRHPVDPHVGMRPARGIAEAQVVQVHPGSQRRIVRHGLAADHVRARAQLVCP